MKILRKITAFLSVLIFISALLPVSALSAESGILSIALSGPDSVYVGSELKITATVGKPSLPLAAIEFTLAYDKACVLPSVTDNSSGSMDSFAVKCPNGWEQVCSYSEQEGKYYLRFADEEGTNPIKNQGELVIEIPFTAVSTGNISFVIESDDIIAISDPDLKPYGGEGSSYSAVVSGENEKLAASFSEKSIEECPAGSVFDLELAVTNLGEASGIIAFEFCLEYDNTVFSPVITANTQNEMDSFAVSFPGNWEQMCTLYADKNAYIIRFAAENVGSNEGEILNFGESALMKIPFRVIGEEGSIGIFNIPYSSVIAVNGVTGIINGVGANLSVGITERIGVPDIGEKYNVINDLYITGVSEYTKTSEFTKELAGFTLTDSNGKVKTEGYVCTGDRLVYSDGSTEYIICVRGDANGNGKVDSTDYVLVKRCVLGTFTFNDMQNYSVSLRNGVYPTASDYALIKRHVLNTFNING